MTAERDRYAVHRHLTGLLVKVFEDVPQCPHSEQVLRLAGMTGVAYGIQACLADPSTARAILRAVLAEDDDLHTMHLWRVEQDLAALREILRS